MRNHHCNTTKLSGLVGSSASGINSDFINYCIRLQERYHTPGTGKNVLFIQVPQFLTATFSPGIARKRGYYAFPPTGLMCLLDALSHRDLDIRILDLNFEVLKRSAGEKLWDHTGWLSILEDYLLDFQPYIVGVSCMYDSGIKPFINVLRALMKQERFIVVTGGVIPTYEWQHLLSRDLCHFVVKGEGENKINYLFNFLTKVPHPSEHLQGISFKVGGRLLETAGKKDNARLKGDLINSYAAVPIREYYKYGSLNPFSRIADLSDSPFAAIQMNRGCRASCTFCSVCDFMGRGVRTRSVVDLVNEMEFLVEQQGIKHFEWLDDDLIYAPDAFRELLETIVARKWQVTWSANNGIIASCLTDEMLTLMRDSGCIGFKIGIETGNAEMLKKIRKPCTLDIFRTVGKRIQKFPEIFVGGNIMIGFPGETFSRMMDSLLFYMEMNLDWGAFTMCQVIRGATAFADFADYFDSQMETDGAAAKNFIPARESSDGRLKTQVHTDLKKGLKVFNILPEAVPGEAQIKEIWFTFNMVGNFIYNKNLTPEGRPDKFIAWVAMAQVAYPTNPYMCLFLALAYVLAGEEEKACTYYDKAVIHGNCDYWRERFDAFRLQGFVEDFPSTAGDVYQRLDGLRGEIREILKQWT